MQLSCVEMPAPGRLGPALPVEAQDHILWFSLWVHFGKIPQFILVESRVKGTKRTPLTVQMWKPRLTLLIPCLQGHASSLMSAAQHSLSWNHSTPINPYICTHHSVLSVSLMTKAIFHKRL